MKLRRLVSLALLLGTFVLLVGTAPASAVGVAAFPGLDCTESPTPDMPGDGITAFFEKAPDPLPQQEDPFASGAKTTIYEQYGYAGLRWHTYDLGCGPDAARNPDAVIGTSLSNWVLNIPVSLSALTSSVTAAAFQPSFMNVFDPAVQQISKALHRSLFATWVPAVIALLGLLVLLKARRAALATTAAAAGWALIVVLLATAVFRWPLEAGHAADQTVTGSLGAVVNKIDGAHTDVPPAVAVSSNIQESLFYHSWVAGTLGSTDSPTARKYGSRLFKAQALTWREAYVVRHDQARGKRIIETKKDEWKSLASRVKAADPVAYENLTGKRSDNRVGYALLSTLGAFAALPFLLAAVLLLLGSFVVVRLAVMLFPAFATLGVFPAGRGLVTGIGRTVGAALVNAVIFGIGAAVTIRVIGVILDPGAHLPGWLTLVLMPLFGLTMWIALKPFRRLTAMVSPNSNLFGDTAGALGGTSRRAGRWAKRAAATGVGVFTGNVAAAAALQPDGQEAPATDEVPERAEARPYVDTGSPGPAAPTVEQPSLESVRGGQTPPPEEHQPTPDGGPPGPSFTSGADGDHTSEDVGVPVTSEAAPLPPVEPEWVDGEEVYTVYRPTPDRDGETAHDAA